MLSYAKTYGVPLLRTEERTSSFMAAVISYLNTNLAPRITRHGVMVEVYGEGMLILGDSGIGKSETAIELVKRGHRLIADDAVEIKRVSAKTLVGTAPELIRYYIELRGIGIVDVRRLFGMGSVKATERIDLVINLENWDSEKMYDRFGLEEEHVNILGIDVPSITIPVHPGRNLAVVLEIAAMNHRQKKMGYNTAEEFNKKLMEQEF
jgi:HPr kinase/phosphorylase